MLASDVLGWVGGIVAAGSYVVVARGWLRPDSARFHALNIGAAAMLAVPAFEHGALSSAYLNLLWIGFGAASVAARWAPSVSAGRRPAAGGARRPSPTGPASRASAAPARRGRRPRTA